MPRGPELLRGPASVPFAATLARHGDAVAIVADDESLTYAQLAERVDEVARQLGGGRRLVLVAGASTLDALVTYLAALAAGHPVLLATAEHVESLAAAYDVDVVAAPVDGAWRLDERREGSAHDLHPDLALLLSTSGSTGSPKLVRLSHENVQANAESIAEYLQIRPTDRAITTLPVHYSYGLSVVNSHLLCGARLVLTDLSVVDGCFWERFRREQVTSFAGVPYTFELLERVGFADMELPHLRYVTQAGGRMAPDRVVRWATAGREHGWDLFVMYGATEATARMAYLPPDLTLAHSQTIGVAIPGGSLAIDPPPDAEDPEVGELVYSGPNVMLGYAEAPIELALGRTVEALRTGDVARRTPEGLYEIVGRRSRFVKVVGLRIDLGRAEQLLGAHGMPVWCAGADDALVVAYEDEWDAEDFRRLAARQLGLPLRAVHAHRVPALPRLPSGKPDYPAISALAPPGAPATDEALPSPSGTPGRDAASLRALFAELLERPEATEQDTFVSLGGDSLSYVEMSMRLEQALGSLPANWHVTPIAELAAAADAGDGRRWGRVVETSIPLRALAIAIVVGTHARLFSLYGGAAVLLAVAGWNFARFQLGPAPRVERLRGQLTSIVRIVVPTVAWIVFASIVATDDYTLKTLFLVNTIFGPNEWTAAWHFWFIEVLLYILIVLALLLAIPPVDRAERRWPWGLAAVVLAYGLLGRYDVIDLGITHRAPVLWLFALGWLGARSTQTWQRLLVSALVVATVPGYFDEPTREAFVAVGILLLLWVPSVRFPTAVARVAAVLASASLYIYITHWKTFKVLDEWPLLAVLFALGMGVVYWKVFERIWRLGIVAALLARIRGGGARGRSA